MCLCCSLEARPVHLCRGGTLFPWCCILGNAESCQSLFQAPFTWLCWAVQGPFLGCTALKSWGDLLLANLHSQTRLYCYALLLGNHRGAGHQAGSIPTLMGREGWIFTYRWANPMHRLWNCFPFVLLFVPSDVKVVLYEPLCDVIFWAHFVWGWETSVGKGKNARVTHCPMSPQSDQKDLSCQSLKIISEQAFPFRLGPGLVAGTSPLDLFSSSRQRSMSERLTWHSFKTLMQYELYVSNISNVLCSVELNALWCCSALFLAGEQEEQWKETPSAVTRMSY